MRQFREYINERLVLNKHNGSSTFFPEQELKWRDTLMHFKNGAALFMFDAEMRGQISDGKYENSGPRDHWRWVTDTVYCIDGNEYHTNYGHEKRYNLKGSGFADNYSSKRRFCGIFCYIQSKFRQKNSHCINRLWRWFTSLVIKCRKGVL